MKGWFFSAVVAPQTLSFCCTGQSRPAVTSWAFSVTSLSFCSLAHVCACVFYIVTLNIIQSSSCCSSPTFFPIMSTICESSLDIFLRMNFSEWKLVSGDSLVRGPLVWDSSQACGANGSWWDINIIAAGDTYTDPRGCNKHRRERWLFVIHSSSSRA